MKNIQILTLYFSNEIASYEVPAFRGALNALLDDNRSTLFHNHTKDGLRFSYPLIQYKRIGGKAAMVCINEGTEAIGEFLNTHATTLTLGERTIEFQIEKVRAEKTVVQVWQTSFAYHIVQWLALNSQNYKEYLAAESLAERLVILEKVLTGNVLSFLKGVGEHVEERIYCKITALDEPRIVTYKGVKMMAFNADFTCNVSLPNRIGLGKDASVGYGVITRKINRQTTNEDEIRH